jgi:hypothetical protein
LGPGGHDLLAPQPSGVQIGVGHRRCPHPECHAYILVVYDVASGSVLRSFPPETIDFDATNLPAAVLTSLEEAVICHAHGCYRAAAIMIRRTLEDVCHDRGATGDSLKKRIESLGTQVVLPQPLLEGLDSLRLLGNDAAHIEAQTYQQVGKEEVELGLDVAKAILLAAYQYSDLVQRLQGLKKP